jgi:hypothetical protein
VKPQRNQRNETTPSFSSGTNFSGLFFAVLRFIKLNRENRQKALRLEMIAKEVSREFSVS